MDGQREGRTTASATSDPSRAPVSPRAVLSAMAENLADLHAQCAGCQALAELAASPASDEGVLYSKLCNYSVQRDKHI